MNKLRENPRIALLTACLLSAGAWLLWWHMTTYGEVNIPIFVPLAFSAFALLGAVAAVGGSDKEDTSV